ncbi:hypothetical protein ACVINW_007041 [Bradyrhizobium sp. USDA 4461]
MAAEIIRRRKDGEDWPLDMERSLDRQRPSSRALPFAWPASRSTTWVWSESLMSETELKIEDLHFHDLRHEGASCTLDCTITSRCIRRRREEWVPLHSLRRRWRGTDRVGDLGRLGEASHRRHLFFSHRHAQVG